MDRPKPSPSDPPKKGKGRRVKYAGPVRFYNDVLIGVDILYEAAISGNRFAWMRLKALANTAILFAGRTE